MQLANRLLIVRYGKTMLLPLHGRVGVVSSDTVSLGISYENIIPLDAVQGTSGTIIVIRDYTGRGRFVSHAKPFRDSLENDSMMFLKYRIVRQAGFRNEIGVAAIPVYGSRRFFFDNRRFNRHIAPHYAVMKVNRRGKTVLVNLADENFQYLLED